MVRAACYSVQLGHMDAFEQLSRETKEGLARIGITAFSNVQKEAVPPAMEGRDLFVKAPPGSGKTAAFLIPILEKIELQGSGKHRPAAIILSPTRELCLQTADVCRQILSVREGIRTAVLTGGKDMNRQVREFRNGADIVIGTPARILDHLRRHTLKLDLFRTLVIDEADEMLAMGFAEDVRSVYEQTCPSQVMLYSATVNEKTELLASRILREPVRIEIIDDACRSVSADHYHFFAPAAARPDILLHIIRNSDARQILVFCGTRQESDRTSRLLSQNGIVSAALHSEMDPGQRRSLMKQFRAGGIRVLCATDVAARGIDHAPIDLVIQYEFPSDPAVFLHRSGRTGRKDKGTVITFLNEKQRDRLPAISRLTGIESREIRLPMSQKQNKKHSRRR